MSGSQYDSADIPIGVQAMVWELFGIDPLISGSLETAGCPRQEKSEPGEWYEQCKRPSAPVGSSADRRRVVAIHEHPCEVLLVR